MQAQSGSWLARLEIKDDLNKRGYLSVDLDSYLELVDWTGRQIKSGKRGSIPQDLKNILTRLNINHDSWVDTSKYYGSWFYNLVCSCEGMKNSALQAGKSWLKGMRAARIAFCT